MNTLQTYFDNAKTWVTANPQDVIYAAFLIVGFTLLTGGSRRR